VSALFVSVVGRFVVVSRELSGLRASGLALGALSTAVVSAVGRGCSGWCVTGAFNEGKIQG
jgi:hypothetical protein